GLSAMLSLKDKLLKAGLVSEEQAKKAETEQAAPTHQARPRFERNERGRAEGPRSRPPPIEVPKLPPLAGSKQAQRDEAKKQLELDRALRELVLGGQVEQQVGATV